jgi:hypothetical protein
VGDLAPQPSMRQMGGLLGALAIALYAAAAVLMVLTARRPAGSRVRQR